MKTIKPPPGPRSIRWTCNHCSAVMEADESEGRRSSDQRDGNAIVFKCPHCKRENWIDDHAPDWTRR